MGSNHDEQEQLKKMYRSDLFSLFQLGEEVTALTSDRPRRADACDGRSPVWPEKHGDLRLPEEGDVKYYDLSYIFR